MVHSRLLVSDRQASDCCCQWFQPGFEMPCSRQKVAFNVPARHSSHWRNHFPLEFLRTGASRQSFKTKLTVMFFLLQNYSKKSQMIFGRWSWGVWRPVAWFKQWASTENRWSISQCVWPTLKKQNEMLSQMLEQIRRAAHLTNTWLRVSRHVLSLWMTICRGKFDPFSRNISEALSNAIPHWADRGRIKTCILISLGSTRRYMRCIGLLFAGKMLKTVAWLLLSFLSTQSAR